MGERRENFERLKKLVMWSRVTLVCLLLIPAIFILMSGVAFASSVPPGVEPGVIEKQFERQPERPNTNVTIPAPNSPEPPPDSEKIEFDLVAVEVVGSEIFGSKALETLFADIVGRRVRLSEIYARVGAISQRYADAGYALCVAFLPPQKIADGRVRIEVVEGYVAEVRFSTPEKEQPTVLRGLLANILKSRPLRLHDLERYLLLANDVPGYQVKTMFERTNTGRGASRLVVTTERQAVNASLRIDHRGHEAIGKEQPQSDVYFNSLFGMGEQIALSVAQSFDWEEFHYLRGGFSYPLGDEGLKLFGSLSYSASDPSSPLLDAIEYRSTGWTGEFGLEHPVIRTRQHALVLSARVTGRRLESTILGETDSADRIYTASLQARYSHFSGAGVSSFSTTLNQGLDVFDATTEASADKSRAGGSGEFTTIAIDASHERMLAQGISGYASLSAQGASRSLLAAEECGIGAQPYGRAYEPSEISGDLCIKSLVQLRVAPFVALQAQDFLGSLSRSLTIHAFFDSGLAWQSGDLLPGESRQVFGHSAGAGVRFQPVSNLDLSAEYAVPLAHDLTDQSDGDGRLYFGIRASY